MEKTVSTELGTMLCTQHRNNVIYVMISLNCDSDLESDAVLSLL